MIFGIDVSAAQGVMDWARVSSEPCVSTHPRLVGLDLVPRFVIAKATEAHGYTDPQFARNVEGARSHGIPVGAYEFFWGHRDPVAQAAHFAAVASALVTTRPVLDFEGVWDTANKRFADIAAIGPAAVIRNARIFGEETEQRWGRPLVVYTGPGWMAQFPDGPDLEWLAARALWVAHYTDGEPMAVKGWGHRWEAHQCDGGGRTKLPTGQPIDGNVTRDLDWLGVPRDTDPAPPVWTPMEVPQAVDVVRSLADDEGG